jgi:hypothetical protein
VGPFCTPITTRFEKTAINFAGMIMMACIHRYLRLLCPYTFSDRA